MEKLNCHMAVFGINIELQRKRLPLGSEKQSLKLPQAAPVNRINKACYGYLVWNTTGFSGKGRVLFSHTKEWKQTVHASKDVKLLPGPYGLARPPVLDVVGKFLEWCVT